MEIVRVFDSVEDENIFSIVNFVKSKLHNRFKFGFGGLHGCSTILWDEFFSFLNYNLGL